MSKYKLVRCEKCNWEMASVSFKKHFDACDGTGPTSKTRVIARLEKYERIDGKCICPHCKGLFAPLGISSHIRRVHLGEKGGKEKGSPAWNKGLTKETDPRVAENAAKVSKAMTGKPGWEWSDEQRRKQSEKKKILYAQHPEKHPNRKLAGNRKKMTYPEKVAFDWLKSSGIEFDHQYKIQLADKAIYPDFRVGNLLIEIDGSYWHDSDADRLRDSALKGMGYEVVRIDAKENIVGRLAQVFQNRIGYRERDGDNVN